MDREHGPVADPENRQQPPASEQAQPAVEMQEAPPPSPTPPRGPSTTAVIAVVVAFALALWLGTRFGAHLSNGWHKLWDATFGGHAAVASSKAGKQFYSCGMHPWVILPQPGDCPICHMELTPIDPSKFTGEVSIDPVVVQNIGVRVQPVTTGPLVKTIRTVGTVAYDETRVRDVSTKVAGWIEKLHVDYLGAEVKQGDVLFDLYAPELYTAQQEYLLALRARGTTAGEVAAVGGVKDLLESARTKLLYFDIAPEQIEALEKAGQPAKTMAIRSRIDGVVIEKNANEGMKVDAGMRIFRIADLSKVWVMVTVYEYQLPYVQVGQSATMSLPYIPGQSFEGKVIYIYPYLNDKTREVKVRLEFDNPNGLLKPGMFANIELKNQLAEDRILAPRSAILDTGTRQVAFVSLGKGKFEPRTVQMGVETQDGMVEIRDGLKPGEMVVTSGQFLLDSEAKIRESLAKMIRGQMAADQKPVVATVGQSELQALPDDVAQALARILDNYFAISEKLASDTTAGIPDIARKLAAEVDGLLKLSIPDDPHFWHKHEEAATVRGKALELIDASQLAGARQTFADLSVALTKLVKATGVPPTYGKEVQELHCPMFLEGQGGSVWLQPAGDVRNPYMGASMLECFDTRHALPVTGQAASDAPKADEPAKEQAKQDAAVSPEVQQQVDALVRAYLDLQQMLTADRMDSAAEHLARIHQAASRLEKHPQGAVADLAQRLSSAAQTEPKDLKAVRASFETMSEALLELAKVAPPSASAVPALYYAYCPMVKKGWLQATDSVRNPYAPYMLKCGSIKEKIVPKD